MGQTFLPDNQKQKDTRECESRPKSERERGTAGL